MGNHEDMLIDYLSDRNSSWLFNGCNDTVESYKGFMEQFYDDIEWMKGLPLYHEDEHFVYVHAGIDMGKPMEEQDKHTMLWVREDFIYDFREYHKRVIFGHTPTISLNQKHKPVYTSSENVAIDTGCVYGGALSALIINDNKVSGFYQVLSGEYEEHEEEQKMAIN